MNVVVVEEGETNGEQEGEEVCNDTDPCAYDPNEVQEDEEGVPLGRFLVIQRLLLTLRWNMVISGMRSSEHDAPLVRGSVI